ncbi:MAG: rRNA maturation RNase YbeY [Akkermansiaceae bacterium]
MKDALNLEVYPVCQSREFTENLLNELHQGWLSVANALREIGVGEIATFKNLEISILDDEEMARIHGEFLNDPSPTDVMSFHHGELLISAQVASRQALEFASSPDREIALYGIHGMLHLAGYDDRTHEEAVIMGKRQEELLYEHFKSL